jgi:hypothetical protein
MAGLDLRPENGDGTEHSLSVAVPIGHWRAYGDIVVVHMGHPPSDIPEIASQGMESERDRREKGS